MQSFKVTFCLFIAVFGWISSLSRNAYAESNIEKILLESANKFATVASYAQKKPSLNSEVMFFLHPSLNIILALSRAGLCFSETEPNTPYASIITALEKAATESTPNVVRQIGIRQKEQLSNVAKINRTQFASPRILEVIYWARETLDDFVIKTASPLIVSDLEESFDLIFTGDENYLYVQEYNHKVDRVVRSCVFALSGY